MYNLSKKIFRSKIFDTTFGNLKRRYSEIYNRCEHGRNQVRIFPLTRSFFFIYAFKDELKNYLEYKNSFDEPASFFFTFAYLK